MQSMQPFEYRVSHIIGTLECLFVHVLAPIQFLWQTIRQSYILAQAANTSGQMCKTELYSPSSRKSIFSNYKHCFQAAATTK